MDSRFMMNGKLNGIRMRKEGQYGITRIVGQFIYLKMVEGLLIISKASIISE